MLKNLRKKRLQQLEIESYRKQGLWWWEHGLVYDQYVSSLGNQRYSNHNPKKSFEYYRPKPNLIPYFGVGSEIYNMIICPIGSFIHRVTKEKKIEKAFLLGETEITQELYYAVMDTNPSEFEDNPKNPVENVSWYDALIFCNKLSDMSKLDRYYTIRDGGKIIDIIEDNQENYVVETNKESKGFRLPTEWEWEYAAKAGTQLTYSGSNNANEVAWYVGNSGGTTRPVKQLNPNAWGFYDMTGNVNEWCENKYRDTVKVVAEERSIRGGEFNVKVDYLRCDGRHQMEPNSYSEMVGFRVARYL